MKAYIASSWFNPVANQEVNDIIEALSTNNFNFFSPRDFFVCPPSADLENQLMKEILNIFISVIL